MYFTCASCTADEFCRLDSSSAVLRGAHAVGSAAKRGSASGACVYIRVCIYVCVCFSIW